MPGSCKLAETQKQEREETEAVSAMALLSVDVDQSFPEEHSRYVQILAMLVTKVCIPMFKIKRVLFGFLFVFIQAHLACSFLTTRKSLHCPKIVRLL